MFGKTTEAPAVATETAAPPPANKRKVTFEHPDTGEQMTQSDLLRSVYAEGNLTRAQLRDWFNEKVAKPQGKVEIVYQAVRAAVNDMGWNQADVDRKAAQDQKRIAAEQQKAEAAKKREERLAKQAEAAQTAAQQAAS